jgi:5-formyltetrahydrofolate cyclo-ligase
VQLEAKEDPLVRSKSMLRRDVLARRNAWPEALRSRLGDELCGHLLAAGVADAAGAGAGGGPGVLAVYAAHGSEASLDRVIAAAWHAGRPVAFPRVVATGQPLQFHLVTSMDALRPAAFGLLEPPATAPLAPLHTLALFLVPGVAFDRQGGRLGHGAGFYDRTLREAAGHRQRRGLERAPAWGVAFAGQVVDRVPSGPLDVPVDALGTEQGLIRCRPSGAAGRPDLFNESPDNPWRHP